MDEKSALKSTTTTNTKDKEWKKKKGYGRILVAVSLALLLSLYAGGHLGSGTNLHHGEMGTKDAAASSSSTSLVGSGTTQGGSSAHCKKNTGYNCGAVFPPGPFGDTCDQKGCCCNLEDGTGYKLNSCDSAKGYAYRGCNSCWGNSACFGTSNINVGTSSCHSAGACKFVSDSTIGNDSCHGGYSCYGVQNATIGKGSCNEGSDSRNSNNNNAYSCEYVANVKIGNNSCNGKKKNGDGVCKECKHNVPDNACNPGITDDMDSNGYCNYCL